jgi:hypothetical protein
MEDLTATSTTFDLKTIERRVKNEGDQFLMITLPSFGKDFIKSLDLGMVGPSVFLGFKKTGATPRFLGGLLDLVFDRVSGALLDHPSLQAISCIHQICSVFAKVELGSSDARESAAMKSYIECEQGVKEADRRFTGDFRKEFIRVASVLFSEPLSTVDRKIRDFDIVPKHGPGATAEKLSSNKKYLQREWTSRLEGVFPHQMWIYPNYLAALEEPFGSVDILEPGSERPSRVISVPKTVKTPRIIAIEPACMQYMQQAISQSLIPELESNHLIGSMIGFSDQGPNRDLARKGSLFGKLATLDLSEASDRVSNQHVRALFSPYRVLRDAIQVTRSQKADVPGFGVKRLAKFASMGSALCFPVEAMVFLTCAFMGISKWLNAPVTPQLVNKFRGKVRVYGDDIIVPVASVESVLSILNLIGFKVNAAKSFWTGKFRESCGGDYYDGEWITPVRLRRSIPENRQYVDQVVSFSSFRNQMYYSGYWRTVRWCDSVLEKVLDGVYPPISGETDAIGRQTYLPVSGVRMCPDLHRPLVKAYVKKDIQPDDNLSGYGALMKFFLKKGEKPILGEHLIRAGRPLASKLYKRWAYSSN